MRSASRTSPVLAVLGVALAVSTGCSADAAPAPTMTPTSSAQSDSATPTPTPTPSWTGSATQAESQSRYDDAIANFPYVLPSGYAFPAKVPSAGRSGEWVTGASPAYQYWACANLDAAWDHADAGDLDGAETLLHAVDEARVAYPDYFTQWEPPRVIQWDNPNERTASESGLCLQWFRALSDDS